jgi:Ca2+-binding RTX toxin-like protein
MKAGHRDRGSRRVLRSVVVGGAVGTGVILGLSQPAGAATTATFASGVLSVVGDSGPNTIEISRDGTGLILVNGGAMAVTGGTPTVDNTTLIVVSGQGGDDVISLNEANGTLPRANLSGGADQDTLTGGSEADQLFGQGGNDTLSGLAGADGLFGGGENDTLIGGEDDDQVFGESQSDRLIWNPGDDTDLNEGGPGIDSVEVYGGPRTEVFAATGSGSRVRFAGVEPDLFSIDIGTSEDLYVIANRGDDAFSATGNLAGLIKFTVDGGIGRDTLLGSDGADLLIGGDGNDVVDGQRGDDTAFLGTGVDTFQWDPGDGNDLVEGEGGSDTLVLNGSNAAERFAAVASGERVRLTRDVAAVGIDTNDVEAVDLHTLGGSDSFTAGDLTGTDLVDVDVDLAALGGGNDGGTDTVVASGTEGDDTAIVTGTGTNAEVTGLHASVSVSGIQIGDRLEVHGFGGDDVVDASGLADAVLRLDGGDDDDVLIGGDLDDVLLGGEGDDVLIGGPGTDTLDGGPDENVVLQLVGGGSDRITAAALASEDWMAARLQIVDGKSVIEIGGRDRTVPRADLSALLGRG